MKIAILSQYPVVPYLGGIERVSHILSEEFRKEGHEVIFIATEPTAYNNSSQDFLSTQYFLPEEKEARNREFLEILQETTPDVIINQNVTDSSYELLKLVYGKGIKIITVYHNQPFAFHSKERYIKKLTYREGIKGKSLKYLGILLPGLYRAGMQKAFSRLLLRFSEVSDRVFLLSDRFINRIQGFMPEFDVKKLGAINNPNTFKIEETSGKEIKENLVIFVGRLEDPQKNVKGFIDVWNEFSKSNPDWEAKIIGDGPHREKFEEYARKKGTKKLEFTGSCRKIEDYYSRAKFLCLTSTYEGWGMVLTEAMAYGCVPFAYGSYESVEDIIQDGVTGYVIPAFDKSAMARAMNEVAKNEGLRKVISQSVRESIKRFEAPRIAGIWIEKLASILQ